MSEALLIANHCGVRRNPFSESWRELVHRGRPLLMELACYPDSRLGQEVERRFGQGSCLRASHWNGADLTTAAGVKVAMRTVRRHHPVHLWVSTECGPFSPLQRINQRTTLQKQRLDEKREQVRKQYDGAMRVARYASRKGVMVHWEWSEKCEAWKLPEAITLVSELGLEKATCHGCCVGLRTRQGEKILCKGWTIATQSEAIRQHLNLRCQRNHPKQKCEAGETAHTARYTEAFARKVIDGMCENEVWSQVVQELSQHHGAAADRGGQQALPAEAEDEDPEAEVEVSTEERAQIEAKLKHIHCSTGHGSIESLRRALQSRGVSKKVLQVARGWSCATCPEWKQKNPRRQATLEGLPKKWERIQIDVGTWTHPVSRRRVQFLMMIDEGSRFRLGHILLEHPSRTGSWKEVREGYEKTWLMMLGKPHIVRADPAGCLRSEEAGRYFEEQNTVLDLVPAEAHWQIGVVEEAIRTAKGMLTQLATDFPEKPTEELFRHAIQAANKRDFQAGYSPYQHALGKAPDEWGRLLGGGASPVVASWEEDFAEDARLRGQAESAFVQETTRRRLERAEQHGRRKHSLFIPGDLVYYWRGQVAGQREAVPFRGGRFLGPARVLATETRQEDGELRPASIVWLHKGGRLIRASPEQGAARLPPGTAH